MNIDFNVAVFTTVFVLEKKSKIIYVSHDSEGDWQFFGSEEDISEEDARVVSLAEIIEMEPSIKELLWMPEGMQCWKDLKSNEWTAAVPLS